jgi:hypothetical protein
MNMRILTKCAFISDAFCSYSSADRPDCTESRPFYAKCRCLLNVPNSRQTKESSWTGSASVLACNQLAACASFPSSAPASVVPLPGRACTKSAGIVRPKACARYQEIAIPDHRRCSGPNPARIVFSEPLPGSAEPRPAIAANDRVADRPVGAVQVVRQVWALPTTCYGMARERFDRPPRYYCSIKSNACLRVPKIFGASPRSWKAAAN